MLETVFSIVICRQMAIENSDSNDFLSTFVDTINVFDCRLPGVDLLKTYRLKYHLYLDPAVHHKLRSVRQCGCLLEALAHIR